MAQRSRSCCSSLACWATGYHLAGAGDLDADGYDDLLISTHAGTNDEVFLLLGPIDSTATLSGADVGLEGEGMNHGAGNVSGGLGDFDGDGDDDMVIGAPGYDSASSSNLGRVYLFYGPVSTSFTSVADADAIIDGSAANDMLGGSCAVGDLDDDGLPDMGISSRVATSYNGRAYLFTGGSYSGSYDAETDADITIDGLGYEGLAGARPGGDHDGDGVDDLVRSSSAAVSSGTGAAYVFLGPLNASSYDTSDADAQWYGDATRSPGTAAPAADIDGDGYDDFILADVYNSTSASWAGAIFVVAGSSSPAGGAVEDEVAVLYGPAGDEIPTQCDLADLDGDGSAEVLASSWRSGASTTNGGCVFVHFGPLFGTIALEDATFRVCGDTYEQVYAVSVPGDLDGDGALDLAVATPYYDTSSYSNAGAARLYFLDL